MSSLTTKHYIEVPPASLDNNKGDIDRINISLANLAGVPRIGHIDWPLDLVRIAPGVMRSSSGRVTITVAADGDRAHVVAIEAGDTTYSHYGVAVDLGTTTVAVELVNLATGRCIAEASGLNGQVAFGDDLLTRLHLASRNGVGEMQAALRDTVNELIRAACGSSGISPDQISAISAAGNTSMTHLFLGLDTSTICREPYAPVINHVPKLKAGDIGIHALPNAVVYVFPSVGSYLGGDLIAGALAAGMAEQDEISLLLDIGTNGEMILGNKDWLLAGAGAAGPALEGGVAECAMRAESGAIDRVTIDPATLEPSCSTIGDAPPTGLCGSGLIDAIAQLYITGLLDVTGRFVLDKKTDHWQEINGRTGYLLVEAGPGNGRSRIYITEKDVQNVLRTKAAMTTALTILLDSVGLTIADIERIYTAGSFGIHLAVDSATAIGLYPRIPAGRFVSLGNGSLCGARNLLLDADKAGIAGWIADKITYVELNVHPAFMGIFRSAKYI